MCVRMDYQQIVIYTVVSLKHENRIHSARNRGHKNAEEEEEDEAGERRKKSLLSSRKRAAMLWKNTFR